MTALKSDQIYGNWATLLLPIGDSGDIDYGLLTAELDYLASCKLNGIYSNGTAGEFYSLNEKEFDKVNQLLAEKSEKSNTPFQIGVSHPSAQISLDRIKRVQSLKPSAFQLILPDWFPVSNGEAIRFLEVMAEAAGDIGLVLYNPPHAKRVLEPEEWTTLNKAVPSLLGVKVFDQDGDDDWYKEMRMHTERLSVFVPGHNLATGITKGAQGAYSNVACLSPFGAQHWYEMMQDDIEEALEIEKSIHRFFGKYITPFITEEQYSNQAVDKLLAVIGGWTEITPRLRWPYRWIPEKDARELRPKAQKMLPEFFFDKVIS